MIPAVALVILGALWIALAFLAVALFLALAPLIGGAWSALLTAVAFLVIVGIGGLVISAAIQRKVEAAKRSAMIAGLASTGAAKFGLGIVTKYPLLSLGIGGAIAAFFISRMSSSK